MEIIIRGNKEGPNVPNLYSDADPRYRKAYYETLERVSKLDPKTIAPERRMMIKAMRFQGKTPELVAKAAAIRAAMTKEINR